MNEDDLRLLQAAAEFNPGDDASFSMPEGVCDVDVEASVAHLSVDQINDALQSLADYADIMGASTEGDGSSQDCGQQEQQQQPPPPHEGSPPGQNTINSGIGFDANLNTAEDIQKLKAFLGIEDDADVNAILKTQNGDSVTGGMGEESEIDYEGQLADLQKSLENLSRSATRGNSPPTAHPTEQTKMSSDLVVRGNQNRPIATEQSIQLANWIASITNFQPGASSSSDLHPDVAGSSERSRDRQSSIVDPFEDPVKAAEKERIRVENRERKKKWRNQNQERNKDNDLRCRVTKRALTLFGANMSLEKSNWIEREFNRRRSKRVTRKNRDIDPASNPNAGSSSVFPAFHPLSSGSPPNFISNNNELVIKDPQSSFLNGLTTATGLPQSDLLQVLAVLSTQPELMAQVLYIMGDGALLEVPHAGSQAAQNFDGRITDISDHIHTNNLENNSNKNLIPHGEVIDQNQNDPNSNWTARPTPMPVPEALEGNLLAEPEGIVRIEPGFEKLVSDLERPLNDEHGSGPEASRINKDGAFAPLEKENNQVKSEPLSPTVAVAASGSPAAVPSLEELVLDLDSLDNLDLDNPETLDRALEDLLEAQNEGLATVNEEGQVQFDEAAMERLIAENVIDMNVFMRGLESGSAPETHHNQAKCIDGFTASTNTDDRRELVQQIHQAGGTPAPEFNDSSRFNIEDNDMPIVTASEMTLEEINSLIADLGDGTEPMPMRLDGESTPAPRKALTRSHPPSPRATEPPLNPDPNNLAQCTPENMLTIIKALIVEMASIATPAAVSEQPPLHVSNNNPQRGTKRSSSSSCGSKPPLKRHQVHTPNGGALGMNAATANAINQLTGLIALNGGFHQTPHHNRNTSAHHPSPTVNVNGNGNIQNPAYVASFGTTDGMNKRLMMMKPPPYRPGGSGGSGSGAGGNGGVAGVAVKRKMGEDERKVRAMGFPPLMAGLKPKLG